MLRILPLLFVLGFSLMTNSQNKTYFKDGLILSLKAGYHFKDGYSEPYHHPALNFSLPGGFSMDATAEIHTGKSCYLGLNYDISFAKDRYYDSFNMTDIHRVIAIYSFTPFLKYRYIVENYSINLGAGIGGNSINTSYDKYYGDAKDMLINYNLRLGFDYAFKNGLLLSSELVYYGMAQLKWHGTARKNRLLQIKTGISFILPKKK